MNFNINEKLVDKIDPETINKEIIIIKDIEAKLDEEIKIASSEKSDIKFIAGIIFGSCQSHIAYFSRICWHRSSL